MKKIAIILLVGILLTGCKNEARSLEDDSNSNIAVKNATTNMEINSEPLDIEITPISHATGVFTWDDVVFYTDPVGGAEAFEGMAKPDFILITDIHGDHMSSETLTALKPGDTKIIVPHAVREKLPKELQNNLIVLNNGESTELNDVSILAIPMYNLPQTKDAMHVKGRGNGYVIQKNNQRLYISGDTEDIPEMRNLKNIDLALISMNLPYTMPVDQAAEGVLAFQPKKVIPYHYRGKDGFADIEEFKKLVNEGNAAIEVELMDWYPQNQE